jgi:hypothetical protein
VAAVAERCALEHLCCGQRPDAGEAHERRHGCGSRGPRNWVRIEFELRRRARATRPVRFTPFARVYIDPCELSRRRRPQALGVIGGPVCPTTQATSCP